MDKKVMEMVIQKCIDELVEDYMLFKSPVIKKSDDISNFNGYGSGERKSINFMFQCQKVSKREVETFVKNYVNTLEI